MINNDNQNNDFFSELFRKVRKKASDLMINLKRNRSTYLIAILSVILVISFTSLIVIVLYSKDNNKTNIDYTTDNKQTLPVDNTTDTKPEVFEPVLSETPDAGDDYLNKIIFLGESTTYHLKVHKVVNANNVWAGESGTLALFNIANELGKIYYPDTGKAMYIWEAAKLKQPEILFITLGLNGSGSATKDSFSRNYNLLIDNIKKNSPKTKIILNTVYPITYDYDRANNGFTNEKIRQINTWIKEIASNKKVYFIDTYTAVSDSNGHLVDAYSNGDGYHLSKDGYNVIIDHIRRHAIKSYVK